MNPLDKEKIGLTKQTYCSVLLQTHEAVLLLETHHHICPFVHRKFLKTIVGLDVNLGFLGHVFAKVGSCVAYLCYISK